MLQKPKGILTTALFLSYANQSLYLIVVAPTAVEFKPSRGHVPGITL